MIDYEQESFTRKVETDSMASSIKRASLCLTLTCLAGLAAIWCCPPYALGLSDNMVAAILGAISNSIMLLSILNAVGATVTMCRIEELRDCSILRAAVVLAIAVVFLTPAISCA